jgi:PIN domain nuclease of toxin-antitoxin system
VRYLFDTHTFIWWDSAPSELSEEAYAACKDETNQLVLSVASIWEMQIKHQLGKLELRVGIAQIVQEQRVTNDIKIIDCTSQHVYELGCLPDHHSDPFDRMLIAQSRTEDLILLTGDKAIHKYPVNWRW